MSDLMPAHHALESTTVHGSHCTAVSVLTTNNHINRSLRILAADDAEINKALAQVQAGGEACDVVAVRDGVETMHTLLGGTVFDLVILDLGMPSLDGLRLIALIRATPELQRIPILAIASPQEPGSTLESLRAGANDYLPRPIEWPLLVMRIRQLTGRI